MSSVVFGCVKCGKGVEVEPGGSAVCPVCLTVNNLPVGDPSLGRCYACGCDELYKHRDFNQKLGLLLIGIGAVAWFVWSTFWPLAFAALFDLVLYFRLPDVAICYRCKAHHRGFEAIASLPGFDLERHEHYKFVRAREEKEAAAQAASESEAEAPAEAPAADES